MHYAWPLARADFWPSESGLVKASGYSVDTGLEQALELGREVLFFTDMAAAFVAIPTSMDDAVWWQLFAKQPVSGRESPAS